MRGCTNSHHQNGGFSECPECNINSTDKSPREFWISLGQECDDIVWRHHPKNEHYNFHVIEHSAYLAVKQELDAARAEIELCKQVSDGHMDARAKDNAEWKIWREQTLKQLADAQAEIELWKKQSAFESEHREKYRQRELDVQAKAKDYESALKKINIKVGSCPFSDADKFGDVLETVWTQSKNIINKWSGK